MNWIQPWHLIVIAIVALVIFGPKRLPEWGRSLARMLHEFKTGIKDAADGVHEELNGDSSKTTAENATTESATTKLSQYCRQCGAANEQDSQYCRKCGAKLA